MNRQPKLEHPPLTGILDISLMASPQRLQGAGAARAARRPLALRPRRPGLAPAGGAYARGPAARILSFSLAMKPNYRGGGGRGRAGRQL